VVLNKVKVISFKDLKKARAKRTKKDKATIGKPKRGHKRKNPALEADILDLKPIVIWITKVLISMLELELELELEPEPELKP